MSKELVISAASHERRVAILEEGQLVEIYIEREKEFALVGSIYKGKVTRVLPGMQSAFVDIGLDGDAFLYVSDVFENLEDYDHDHAHETPRAAAAPAPRATNGSAEHEAESHSVELLPGESLAKASSTSSTADGSEGGDESIIEVSDDVPGSQSYSQPALREDEHAEERQPGNVHEHSAQDAQPDPDERQPESNASAPQNFGPNYKSSNYSPRGSNDRPGQNFGRGTIAAGKIAVAKIVDRIQAEGAAGDSGAVVDAVAVAVPGAAPGGRNLPPSKYAAPQGSGEARGPERGNDRGNDRGGQGQNRGGQNRGFEPRGFENRRPENPRHGGSTPVGPSFDTGEEPILLPGESLAKYRGKPAASSAAPVVEQESIAPGNTESSRQPGGPGSPAQPAGAGGGPRRFTGGLPRWLLADAGAESEAAPVSADENIGVADDSTLSAHGNNPARHEASPLELPDTENAGGSGSGAQQDPELSEDQIAALASGIVEAKQEEVQEEAHVDARSGGAIFEEEEAEEAEAEEAEERARKKRRARRRRRLPRPRRKSRTPRKFRN